MFKGIKNFLERLAKSNEETFGPGGLNCCGMKNRPVAVRTGTNARRRPVSNTNSAGKSDE